MDKLAWPIYFKALLSGLLCIVFAAQPIYAVSDLQVNTSWKQRFSLSEAPNALPSAAAILRAVAGDSRGTYFFWTEMGSTVVIAEYNRQFPTIGWRQVNSSSDSEYFTLLAFEKKPNRFVVNSEPATLLLFVPRHRSSPIGVRAQLVHLNSDEVYK